MTTEATAPETGTEPTPTDTGPEQTPTATVEELAAEVEKWKAQSRKNEDRAKANAKAQKELDDLKQQSMTEQERAVEQARIEARTETLREIGETRVGDAFRVATAGRPIDVDELLDGINLTRFLTDDGTPDTDAVQAWVDKVAPKPEDTEPNPFPDLGQGARGGTNGIPLGSDQLERHLKHTLGIS